MLNKEKKFFEKLEKNNYNKNSDKDTSYLNLMLKKMKNNKLLKIIKTIIKNYSDNEKIKINNDFYSPDKYFFN